MRNFSFCRWFVAIMLMLPFMAGEARAQEALSSLTQGKVYRFVNRANGLAMGTTSYTDVKGVAADEADYSQLWYVASVTDGKYGLRNLGNGAYLKGNGQSALWTTVPTESDTEGLYLLIVGETYNTLSQTNNTSGYDNAHYADSQDGHVVGWATAADATQWTISEVEIADDVLAANWEELEGYNVTAETLADYQTALDNLFSDKACTALKKSFADEAALKADGDYAALPAVLQRMVQKVYSRDWAENNYDAGKASWGGGYAKKFRVQMYEPYNEPEAAARALGINAHTNLNNPTGIFVDRAPLYVMVEGEIKEGASLYLASYSGHGKLGGYDAGTELHEGLNVIPFYVKDNNLCINYVVHAFDTTLGLGNAAKARRLSEYPDLKIHIEGGYVNGYWNRVGDALYEADTHADWDYYKARATRTDLTVLGKYMTLQFPLKDEDTNGNKGLGYYFNEQVNVETVIEAWDNIMMWERLLMGVMDETTVNRANATWKSRYPDPDAPHAVYTYTGNDADNYGSDYSDYYNVHGLAFGVNSGYMYGGWDHSGYHFNTMNSIIGELPTNAGSQWGPAHEIGHQNQGPLTMRGETEVTNNLFSNMVLWFFGKTTSRVNGTNGSLATVLSNYNEGRPFCDYDIWALTHLYYKLFLYYHVLGNNTKFYPRLYEMLRQEPLNGMAANIDGGTAMLRFYKFACEAAGEDLTDFFRAYGFFVPLDNYAKDDYGVSYYTMTREQVDAAIAEVKAKGYPENQAVLFINDYTGDTSIIGSTGETLTCYDQRDGAPLVNADMGSYASFDSGNAGSYACTVEGTTLTLEGEGGVGFIVRNEAGEIIAFSDKRSFTLTPEVQDALARGGSIQAQNSDNTAADVAYDATALQRNLLSLLIGEAEGMVGMKAEENNRPGFYKADCLAELEEQLAHAHAVCDGNDEANYSTAYDRLKAAVEAVEADPYAKMRVLPGTYVLGNKKYPAKNMSVNSENKLVGENKADTDAQKWVLEAAGEEDIYYIRCKSTETYVEVLKNDLQVEATETDRTGSNVTTFRVKDLGDGSFTFTCLRSENAQMLNYNPDAGKILGWGATNDEASHWYLTAVEVDEASQARYDLDELISRTNVLLEEMGDDVVHARDNVGSSYMALQVADAGAGMYLSSNADQNTGGGGADGGGIAALLDGDVTTYFHSRWGGTAVSEAHHLQVDLGAGRTLSDFVFNYSTRRAASSNETSPAPTSIAVSGSNDGAAFTPLATFSSADAGNPLPPYTQLGVEWTSGLVLSGADYRYLRFAVTGSAGPGGNKYNEQYFFAMSEFRLLDADALKVQVNSLQAAYEGKGIEPVYIAADVACCKGEMVRANAGATVAQMQAVTAELREKYEALSAARKRSALPVVVTTDAANPVLYRIGIKRDDKMTDPVLTFDEATAKVGVARYELGDKAQAWYFLDGSTVGRQVLICPYTDGENTPLVLASDAFEEGWEKVSAVEKDAEGYVQDWTLTANADHEGYYNITCLNAAGTAFYFSNNGGVTKKMGFYNDPADGGSLFTFERVAFDRSEAYCRLYNYYTYDTRVKGADVTGSDKVGCYPAEAAAAYNAAYATAAGLLADDAATDENLAAAYEALKAANEALALRMPEAGRYYAVRSAHADKNGALMYADGTNTMYFDSTIGATEPKAVWTFEPVEGTADGFRFRNLQTGCVLDKALGQYLVYTLGEGEAVTLTLNSLSAEDGQMSLTPAGAAPLHAQANGQKIVSWSEGVNSASAWYVEEVDAAEIAFAVTVTAYGYAGLHLNYPVAIPDGLEAYIITTAAKDEGVAYLRRIEGGVIPANTGVILRSAEAEGTAGGKAYSLCFAAEGGTLPTTKLLRGSNYLRYVQAEAGTDYYLFGAKDTDGDGRKEVGLYQAWEEYSADGTIAEGNAGTDNGGYFRCQANKIYLPYDTSAQGLAGFTFRFDEEGTGIRPVVEAGGSASVVYDLQGRRILRITAPGVYIVNGRKLVVKHPNDLNYLNTLK